MKITSFRRYAIEAVDRVPYLLGFGEVATKLKILIVYNQIAAYQMEGNPVRVAWDRAVAKDTVTTIKRWVAANGGVEHPTTGADVDNMARLLGIKASNDT